MNNNAVESEDETYPMRHKNFNFSFSHQNQTTACCEEKRGHDDSPGPLDLPSPVVVAVRWCESCARCACCVSCASCVSCEQSQINFSAVS